MIEKFRNIFEGLDSAYGQYIKGDRGSNGKQGGKAFIVRKEVSEQLWVDHLQGKEPALGIIPINKDNKCKWGCIDIDDYNLNHKELINNIRQNKFPLIVFRSKSGGAHVFLFMKEFTSAQIIQDYLKKVSKVLDKEGCEIFPKQTEILIDRGDIGNFLNLPYHNGDKSLRYAIDDEGNAADINKFFSMYEQYSCTEEQIADVKIETPKKKETFEQGPPCLNTLAETGFGEGGRNNALFDIGVFFKKADPDKWEDLLEEANVKFMNPPLKSSEVQGVIKSLNKKGYDKYRCKEPPINGVCKSAICRTKRYGVGFDDEHMPELHSLTKFNSKPPQWFLTIGNESKSPRIELTTEQLYSPVEFAKACLDQANLIIPNVKAQDWRQLFLKPLIQNVITNEPLESLDNTTQLSSLIFEFTTNRSKARTKEDILNKTAWTDDQNEYTYFRMSDFYSFAKRNNWELDKTKTGNLIKQLKEFVGEPRMELKNSRPRVIQIKTMKPLEAATSKKTYVEEHF